MKIKSLVILLHMTLGLNGCGGGQSSGTEGALVGSSASRLVTKVFPLGCDVGRGAVAEQIISADFHLTGSNALGGVGDYIIANDEAAFVISGIGPQKTYFHYNGILIDAVTLDKCEQSSEDDFYELALMVVRANIGSPTASRMRAFRGESVEIVNDGSNGDAAVVRVHGTDDTYWLAETVLMQESQLNGVLLDYSRPFGLDIEVDYILPPGSRTLQIEYRLKNNTNQFNSISAAFGLLAAGMGPSLNTFSAFDIELNKIVDIPTELAVQYSIPWVTGTSGQSSFVYGTNTNNLTAAHVIGVDGLVDITQVFNTWVGSFLAPSGRPKDTLVQNFNVTVGNQGEVEAVSTHLVNSPTTVKTLPTQVQISVTDAVTGAPVEGALIEFQTRKQILLDSWPWETFLSAKTDAEGKFTGSVSLISYLSNQTYRTVVSAPGRIPSDPVPITPSQMNNLSVNLPPAGKISYRFVDQAGDPIPTQLSLWKGTELVGRFYLNKGTGELDVEPGEYDVGISHGWEYEVVEKPIMVEAGKVTILNESLRHWVDTTGYMSFDAHVHSSPSADSTVAPADRLTTAAATGLEVVVSTDHEIVFDLSPAITEAGLEQWVATVVGQEVTAALPNHTITYPLPVIESAGPRGQPVEWYGMDIAQIFAAEKARGGKIRTLAHPRMFVLDAIQWDRVAGAPGVASSDGLGIPEGGSLWSWDFEAVEYMNGTEKVFSSGLFDDWMSFLNHGHKITGTGSSDMHHFQPPGMPRNYFASPTDSPSEFEEGYLVDAVVNNRVVVSTGAFARVVVNDQGAIGDTVRDSDGTVNLKVHIEALPQTKMSFFKVYVNCNEAQKVALQNPSASAIKFSQSISLDVPTSTDSHIVVLGFGAEKLNREFAQFDPRETPLFTTNPVFVDANGNGVFDAPGGRECQYDY